MHQFYTLSVAALLATSALAAPAPKPPKGEKPAKLGHFSAAIHGHKHKGPANPLAEMKHIFGKYDWKFDVSKFDTDIPHFDLPKIDLPKGPPGKDKAKSYGQSQPGKKAGLVLDLSEKVQDKVQAKADVVSGLVGGITDTIGSLLDGHDKEDSDKDTDKDSDKDDEEDHDDEDDDEHDDEDEGEAPGYGYEPETTLSTSIKPTASKKPKHKTSGVASVSPIKSSHTPSSVAPAPAPPSSKSESSSAPAPPTTTSSSESYPEPTSEAPVTSEAPTTSTSSYVEPTSAAPQPSSEPAAPSSSSVTVTYEPSFSFAPTTTATTVESSSAPATSSSAPPPPPPPPSTSSIEVPPTTSAPATTAVPSTSSVVVAPSSTKKSGNSKVTAAAEVNEAAYLSPVTVGGQVLNLNFDTGSADLWVFSSSLPEAQRFNHTPFDPAKSPSWQPLDGHTWSIAYGDGSSASGTVGYDTVVVGAATATRQAVEIATTVSDKFAKDYNNDGLVGLSFGSINTVRPTQQKTFFENIQAELDAPLFTADLRQDTEVSTYEFGVIDTTKYQGEIHYTPVDSSKGHWEFASTTYKVGSETFTNEGAHPAIADTGTSLILADQAVVTKYYGAVAGAVFNQQVGGYTYSCSAALPDFGLQIGSSGFTAVIPGADMTYAPLGNGDCFGGLQSNGGGNYQILGDVLFKKFFAVFNGGEKKFGLAAKA